MEAAKALISNCYGRRKTRCWSHNQTFWGGNANQDYCLARYELRPISPLWRKHKSRSWKFVAWKIPGFMNPSKNRYESARTAIEASYETLSQIAESRAEMSALEELITVQEELEKSLHRCEPYRKHWLRRRWVRKSSGLKLCWHFWNRKAGFHTLFSYD